MNRRPLPSGNCRERGPAPCLWAEGGSTTATISTISFAEVLRSAEFQAEGAAMTENVVDLQPVRRRRNSSSGGGSGGSASGGDEGSELPVLRADEGNLRIGGSAALAS